VGGRIPGHGLGTNGARQRHHARAPADSVWRAAVSPKRCTGGFPTASLSAVAWWIGPGNRTYDNQRDLRSASAVLTAARCHVRLHRNHRDATQFRHHRCHPQPAMVDHHTLSGVVDRYDRCRYLHPHIPRPHRPGHHPGRCRPQNSEHVRQLRLDAGRSTRSMRAWPAGFRPTATTSSPSSNGPMINRSSSSIRVGPIA
jgi:hypothetical protein